PRGDGAAVAQPPEQARGLAPGVTPGVAGADFIAVVDRRRALVAVEELEQELHAPGVAAEEIVEPGSAAVPVLEQEAAGPADPGAERLALALGEKSHLPLVVLVDGQHGGGTGGELEPALAT